MHVFDKSCIVYPKDINIFLLALIEIAIASIPVVIIKFIELFKGAYVEENNK